MTPRIIAATISLCMGTTAAILGNMFLLMIAGDVNRRKGQDARISYFLWTFPKLVRTLQEYRTQYPGGNLHVYFWAAVATAMAAFLILSGIILSF